jgi:hypothetical protein
VRIERISADKSFEGITTEMAGTEKTPAGLFVLKSAVVG